MPSHAHDLPLLLLRECPELIPQLIGASTDIALPRYHTVKVEDSDLSQLVPVELRADLVITLRDAHGRIVAGIVLESQTRIDPIKAFTWPLYAIVERARIRCPVYLVVFTSSPAVARWAAAPIPIGPDGASFRCIVIGPQEIPRIRTPGEAHAQPELAVLSAISHGNERDGLEIARAALDAAARLDDERRTYYHEVVWEALGAAARRQLEESMLSGKKLKITNPFDRWFRESRAAGLAEGRAEGLARGQAEGIAEGIAKGKAEGVITVLTARGIRISKTARTRILRCRDLPTLDRWLARAAVVRTTAELFSENT